jgi:hypothetical protein
MGDPIQLAPFDFASDEEELRRRREAETRAALERLQMPRAAPPPLQEDVEAQATGDAYRAMSDDEADTIQGRSRDEGTGGRVYAAGDIPPPENQRQRMMDASATRAVARTRAEEEPYFRASEAQVSRPEWMADVADPREALRPDHRVEEIPLDALLSGPAPSSGPAAPMASTPAGDAKAPTPPSASPAGRDYTVADVGDALRRIPFALGNALSAAAGRPTSQFRSEGRELRDQDRRQALRDQQQAGRERSEALRIGMQRESLDAQRQSREESLALQREGLDRGDARAQAALDQRAELAAQDPRRAAFQREAERQAQLALPDSPATNAIREQVRLQRDLLPGAIRNGLGLTDARLASMTGEALDRISGSLPRPSVGIRGSGGSPGASGGPRSGDAGESVIRDAVASGIPENTARAMYANPRTRAQLMNRIATHPGTQSAPGSANIEDDPLYQEALRQGVPPVTAREMAQDPDERSRLRRSMTGAGISERRANEAAGNDQDLKIAAARDAMSQLEAAMPPEGQDIPGVGTIDSLRGGGFFQSPDGRRTRTLAENAVMRYLRLESGGVIGPQEFADEMQRRGMAAGATEQQFRDGMRDLRRDLDARSQRRERGSGNQAQPAAPAARPGRTRVRINGTTGWWPADRPLPPGAEPIQ